MGQREVLTVHAFFRPVMVTHRNEKYNRYEISRQQKKRELKKNSTIAFKNPKTRFYGGSESNDFRVACGVEKPILDTTTLENIRDS